MDKEEAQVWKELVTDVKKAFDKAIDGFSEIETRS